MYHRACPIKRTERREYGILKTQTAKVKLKGYKKFMRRIRNIRKETEKLNRTIERAVELRKELL